MKLCNGPLGRFNYHQKRSAGLNPKIKDGGPNVGAYRDEKMICKNCGDISYSKRLVDFRPCILDDVQR